MQSARSFLRRMTVVFLVTLALALVPAAWAAPPTLINRSPRPTTIGVSGPRIIAAVGTMTGKALAVVTAAPKIASLSPAAAVAGGAAFTLTINGRNFTSTSTSKWGTSALKTTYKSTTQLTAAVPANLVATPGTASVAVITAGGTSSGAAFTITLPPPTITNLNPTTAIAGRAFTMTINGKNFVPLAAAKWGSTPLTTTYVSGTQLTAAVPAGLAAAAGKALVTVSTSGGISSAATLAVTQPAPTITSLGPNSVLSGSQTFTLTINGANYLPGAGVTVARWNYTPLTTTYLSCTQLTAVVPANLVTGSGTFTISVVAGGTVSSGVLFTVNPALPTISSISPGRLTAGNGDFILSVYGTYFSATAIVNWGTTALVTSSVGGSTLAAKVPANLVATTGTFDVTVTTAGGTSAPAKFSVSQPLPTISSLNPASTAAGGANFTLTINGRNFASNSQARLGTTWIAVTYVSSTQLTAVVLSSAIASAGSTGVTVYISGLGWSPSATFTINPAPPAITSLSPASVTAGGAGFMLTIKGTAFTPATTCIWGATSLGAVYVSPTQLIAAVPASLIVDSGSGNLTVTTGTGRSAPATFTINPASPAIGGLRPGLATAGGAAFTLTINGAYFTSASTAKWGSTALATTYVNATELTAVVPAKLIANAGAASITVTSQAGTSAPAAFTTYPAPRIVTTAVPSGTAGNAYSGAISVIGGVPGYTWTVAGLPSSMSFFNTSGSTLTITGTPTEPGAVNFKVSVEDTSGVTAGPVTYTLNVADGPSGANNGRLNGSYVCLLQGFIDYDGSRWASLASFQADGKGHFSTGVFDTNSQGIGSASGTITGNYSLGSDNNGLASTHTILTDGAAGNQTTQWALALSSRTLPAQEFRMVEVDDLGERPSGQQGTADCSLATPSAFAARTISGSSFAFGLDGQDHGGTLKAAAGIFCAANGKIASGAIDLAQGGNANLQTAVFTGTYTAPDPVTGRFKIALKAGGRLTGLTVYIIDANRMFILDNSSNDGEQAGNMRKQQQASYSAASINNKFVLYMRGAEFNNNSEMASGYYASVFEGDGDGAGNISINQSYMDDNGVYSAGISEGGPIALAFDSTHLGRATFQSASGSTYLYLFDANSAFKMSVGDYGSVDTGWLEPQTQTVFTSATLAGNYLFGALPLLNAGSNGSVGELNVTGSSTMNGAVTTAGQNNLSWDQAASMTYSWDTTAPGTGTFLVANGPQGGASCAVISATKFVCTPQTDSSPSVQVIGQ